MALNRRLHAAESNLFVGRIGDGDERVDQSDPIGHDGPSERKRRDR